MPSIQFEETTLAQMIGAFGTAARLNFPDIAKHDTVKVVVLHGNVSVLLRGTLSEFPKGALAVGTTNGIRCYDFSEAKKKTTINKEPLRLHEQSGPEPARHRNGNIAEASYNSYGGTVSILPASGRGMLFKYPAQPIADIAAEAELHDALLTIDAPSWGRRLGVLVVGEGILGPLRMEPKSQSVTVKGMTFLMLDKSRATGSYSCRGHIRNIDVAEARTTDGLRLGAATVPHFSIEAKGILMAGGGKPPPKKALPPKPKRGFFGRLFGRAK
jgi:hypothetical protein